MPRALQRNAFQRALARLDPRLRAEMASVAALADTAPTAVAAAAAILAPATSVADSETMRRLRRVKSTDIGLERGWSAKLLARGWAPGGERRECPSCGYRWVDKYRKDECPKCVAPLAMPQWQRNKRVPGEASTFKQPPTSVMESRSGVCYDGEPHHFRLGRCRRCGMSEGKAVEEAFAAQRPAEKLVYVDRETWLRCSSPIKSRKAGAPAFAPAAN